MISVDREVVNDDVVSVVGGAARLKISNARGKRKGTRRCPDVERSQLDTVLTLDISYTNCTG